MTITTRIVGRRVAMSGAMVKESMAVSTAGDDGGPQVDRSTE